MKGSRLTVACALAVTVSICTSARAAGLGTTPGWSYDGTLASGLLGRTLAVADVNGDGYGDLVVGQPDGGVSPGVIYIFFGGAGGPSASPSQTLTGGVDFVRHVAAVGDWNGDGFQDIVVGGTLNSASAASVYLGSPSGLATSAAWIASGFGTVVAGAGDVNGDGYDDILTSDPNAVVGGLTNVGRAFLFLGGPSASTTPAWNRDGGAETALLGNAMNGAGDVNNDGYDDVIISEPGYIQYTNKGRPTVTGMGRVSLFLGAAGGLATTPAWVTVGPDSSGYGQAVASAGDVNGDGFDDICVGANQADVKIKGGGMNKPTGSNRGMVFVYYGSPAGPSSTASWTATGDLDESWLGNDVVAGDFNHDGFSDLAVSAPRRQSPSPSPEHFPRVYAYLGGPGGLATTAAWFVDLGQVIAGVDGLPLASGKVNGDLYDDLLVGAPAFSPVAGSEAGRAELYLGQAN